jgi:hypothetical protein
MVVRADQSRHLLNYENWAFSMKRFLLHISERNVNAKKTVNQEFVSLLFVACVCVCVCSSFEPNPVEIVCQLTAEVVPELIETLLIFGYIAA